MESEGNGHEANRTNKEFNKTIDPETVAPHSSQIPEGETITIVSYSSQIPEAENITIALCTTDFPGKNDTRSSRELFNLGSASASISKIPLTTDLNSVPEGESITIAPHASQIPAADSVAIAPRTTDRPGKNGTPSSTEMFTRIPTSASISKFPLTADLNCVPSEVEISEPSLLDTRSNPQNVHVFIDIQGKTLDHRVIASDGVTCSISLFEGDNSAGEKVQVPPAAIEDATEIKGASDPERLSIQEAAKEISEPFSDSGLNALVSKGEINLETENGFIKENLDARGTSDIQSFHEVVSAQEKVVEALIVDPPDGEPVMIDKTREDAQGKDPKKMEDSSQKEETELNIESIKGQKVRKKFGKKSYLGDVVAYDPESKWFKVVYEDGDEEDLELWEVKEILTSSGSMSSTTKKRGSNKSRMLENVTPAMKAKKSSRESDGKSPKDRESRSKKFSPMKQAKNPGSNKGKIKTSDAFRSLKLVSPKNQKKGKSRGSEASLLKIILQQETFVKRKAEEKEQQDVKKMKTEGSEAGKTKDISFRGDDAYVGRNVKKDFGGKLYDGVVVKFDKRTQYYKVKYEDGDQEELELHELQPILI